MLGNPDSKPHFFSDKALEPTIRGIVRRFPLMDTKSSSVSHVTLHCRGHVLYHSDESLLTEIAWFCWFVKVLYVQKFKPKIDVDVSCLSEQNCSKIFSKATVCLHEDGYHPTNQARRRVTLLICPTTLPLCRPSLWMLLALRSRIYATVRRPSLCPIQPRCGGFAAVGPAGRRYWSSAARRSAAAEP